jgi:hypothetical protein
MARRKNKIKLVLPEHWEVSKELDITKPSGQVIHLELDTVIGIEGERGGRFRFKEHVVNTQTGQEWITVCGGTAQGTPREVIMFRSFDPSRVTRTYKPVKRRKK